MPETVVGKGLRFSRRVAREGLGAAADLFPPMRPAAIVVGGQKCGTTALYRYLAHHPKVAPSKLKEINFFSCAAQYAKGLDHYHAHFPRRSPANRGKATFDVTPAYLGRAEQAAPRIHAYDSEMKLIVLLRDPVERAYSAWHHCRRHCEKKKTWFADWITACDGPEALARFTPRQRVFGQDFEEDMQEEETAMQAGRVIEMPILRLGLYADCLMHYFKMFPRDRVQIISSEEMVLDTVTVLHAIESFVGLPPHAWTDEQTKRESVGGYSTPLDESGRQLLRDLYRAPNEELFKLLDRAFPWT